MRISTGKIPLILEALYWFAALLLPFCYLNKPNVIINYHTEEKKLILHTIVLVVMGKEFFIMSKCKVIAVANQKGDVGKTTTVSNVIFQTCTLRASHFPF